MSAALTDHAAAFTEAGTYRDRLAALRLLPSRQAARLAADWAETVLPVWESAYPGDDRPRRAIEAARDGARYVVAAHAAYAAAAHAAAHAAHAARAAHAAVDAAHAADAAAHAAVDAAHAAHAAHAAAYAARWDGVRRLWESAYNDGHAWQPAWATPLAVEMARDPEAYHILLDLLEDQGVPVEGLRGAGWARSNWAVYHLLEGKS